MHVQCKGIAEHGHLKKEVYQPQNTKIPSSRRIAFSAEKGITLIRLIQRINLSIFSCRSARGTLTQFSPTLKEPARHGVIRPDREFRRLLVKDCSLKQCSVKTPPPPSSKQACNDFIMITKCCLLQLAGKYKHHST